MVTAIVPNIRISTHKLSEEECQNPNLVIKDLFYTFSYDEIKVLIWEWLVSTFCENFSTGFDSDEKVMITVLYEKIERLIDAAHILYSNEKQL
ncbi:hypothetical protein [Asinibacterium sp. OR53]|uniref:hypothetical protein n=1 Tax=Asinibacterium sp. OR53 TaxID=925409 RepID=UPI0004792F77|nr:hypothetical protein [Asinibacterium sp. OR53]